MDLPFETMTADNGKEFAAFGALERNLGLAVYFAQPYHAWERGLNENTNGLLRQFFPKGLDIVVEYAVGVTVWLPAMREN